MSLAYVLFILIENMSKAKVNKLIARYYLYYIQNCIEITFSLIIRIIPMFVDWRIKKGCNYYYKLIRFTNI